MTRWAVASAGIVAAFLTSCAAAAPSGPPKWGYAHSTPQKNAEVMQLVTATAQQASESRGLYTDFLFVGPALWARLKSADPSLQQIGTPSTMIDPTTNGRMESRAFQKEQVDDLLRAPAFIAFIRKMSSGAARAATALERELFYYTIPFEIASDPIAVVQSGNDVVVILVSDGKAGWLDLLSGYGKR